MLGEGVKRRQAGRKSGKGRAGGRKRSRWRWIGFPLAVVVPLVVGYLVSTFVLFPPREVSGAGIPVPELLGMSTAEAQRATTAAGLGPIEPVDMPHPQAQPGTVLAQDPLPGQQLLAGRPVRVAISAGRPRAPVPDVAGYSEERARTLLSRAGFQVSVTQQQSSAAAGRVLRTEPTPGQHVTLPATVRIVVSSGPPTVDPDTLLSPADTMPLGAPSADPPADGTGESPDPATGGGVRR